MKPIVKYHDTPGNYIRKGHRAIVVPINHSGLFVSNEKPVITTPVIRHDEATGTFETENTIYQKE